MQCNVLSLININYYDEERYDLNINYKNRGKISVSYKNLKS